MASLLRPLAVISAILACCLQVGVAQGTSNDIDSDGPSTFAAGYGPDVVLDVAWNDTYPDFEGLTLLEPDVSGNASDYDLSNLEMVERRADGDTDFFLRIMPLGASVTQGVQSTDGNGYRKWLRSELRYQGWKVNMVGSLATGSMADKASPINLMDHEGHSGFIIDGTASKPGIRQAFASSKWMMPNLVLINGGTNDCNYPVDPPNAGKRMGELIDDVFNSIPNVVVVFSTIAKSRLHDDCAADVSQQYRDLFSASDNPKLQLADLHGTMTAAELGADGIHPNDSGYKLFAAIWWDAIRKVQDQIEPAADAGIDDTKVSSPKTCKKKPGNARGPVQSQKGSGFSDELYVHSSNSKGVLADARIPKGDKSVESDDIPSHMFFAQLVNAGNVDRSKAVDDWVRVYHDHDTGKNTYYLRENLGGGKFGKDQVMDVDQNCDTGPNYAWADFNNDGRADFFCLGADSRVTVSLNRGGNPPKFESIGPVVPTHAGFVAADVRIADIDGDGRADYCLVHDNGDIGCSRNAGQGDSYYWQGFTTAKGLRNIVFTSKDKGDKRGVMFGDLNGDFRSDWMWIGDKGDVDTWINQRGWVKGEGIVPDWTHSGITHPGMNTAGVRDQIKFGRIYGSGKLDYLYIQEEDDWYDVHAWENTGHGGTKRKGDGNFYCDMRGSGSDDYVWIYDDGHEAEIFANLHSPPDWSHQTKISLSIPGPRTGIHLADWNGDGKCDVLVQDKVTGALTLHENHFDQAKNSLTFVNVGVVTPHTCSQGWGVNIFDRGMRLADIDGDGRADVLCIEPNGRVTAWLNAAGGMSDAGQIKFPEGWDRANIRFADVESSGRADMIHLNKYTGAAEVYKNLGHKPGGGGSSFSWANRGVLYSPIGRGETMHFTNQGGLGRADLVHVLPVSNKAYTYFNECGGSSGGDDGTVTDPGLPPYSTGDDGDTGPVDGDPPPDIPRCLDLAIFNSVEKVVADFLIPDVCINTYLMGALSWELSDALDSYDDIESDGYKEKYGYYVKAIKKAAPAQWDKFYYTDVNDYFTCHYDVPNDDGGYDNKTGGCPPDNEPDFAKGHPYNLYFVVNDKDKFHDKIQKDYGLEPSWLVYDSHRSVICIEGQPCDEFGNVDYLKVSDDITIPDPADVITKSLKSYRDISDWLWDTAIQSSTNLYSGLDSDVVDAASMSVMSVKAAATAMQQVVDIGEKEEEDEALEIILYFLTAFLLLLPGIGEELSAITDVAIFARLADMVAIVGDTAMTVYGIIQDPSSAPMEIGGLLLGGLGARADSTFTKAAKVKRALPDSVITKLGSDVSDGMAKVSKRTETCSL